MATPTKTWIKLTRRMGGDGNPLRRRSDVFEAWLLPAAIAIFLALSPLVAVAAGMWVHAGNAAMQRTELSSRKVQALLLRSAPGPEMTDNGANSWMVPTLAQWTVDGRQYVGDIPAPAKSRAGSTATVYLNSAGQVLPPPLTPAQLSDVVFESILAALLGLALVVALLAWVVRRALRRRRFASWDAEWLAVAPRWSSQL